MIRDTVQNLKGLLAPWDGSLSPLNAVARVVLDELISMTEQEEVYTKAAVDAMASDVTAAQYFYRVPRDCDLVDAYYLTGGTIAAAAANTATIICNKHDGAGGAGTASFSRQTITGNSVAAGVPFALTASVTAADLIMTAGQVLSFQITKQASGVVVPAGVMIVRMRNR